MTELLPGERLVLTNCVSAVKVGFSSSYILQKIHQTPMNNV
ncbi:MAG: hypothetical protein OWS03_11415 [Alicyclobacillaceae bacterium]|nr:hypothetical protein [Alicyclobacillaceae bacterium]